MKGNITIRRVEANDEYLACLELQKSTWGEGFVDLASPAIMKVTQRLGGVTAGAFDRWSKLVGFVFGFTGYRHGEPVHWSDMLAVRPEWRGMGIGKRLKLFQRQEVMKLGASVIFWTYDPLEARNANLNLNGLGVLIDEYIENMYATDEGSTLRSGLGTDRFVVRWPIADERVLKTLQGESKPCPEEYSHTPIVNTAIDAGGKPVPVQSELPDDAVLRIEIPSSVQDVKERSAQEGYGWRLNTRRAFTHYLGRDYRIVTFYIDPDTGRCFYVLEQA